MHSGLWAGYRIFFPHHPTPCQFCWFDPSKSIASEQKKQRLRKLFWVKPWADRLRGGPRPPVPRPTCLKLPELLSVILLQRCLFLTKMLWELFYPEIKSMSRARKYPSSHFFLNFLDLQPAKCNIFAGKHGSHVSEFDVAFLAFWLWRILFRSS